MKIFYGKFPKIIFKIWIQQFYFGRKQKYLWKCFYTIKKPLKNRAIEANWDFLSSDCSNLNLMRWWILLIVSFVSINSDKMTVWWTKIIKWTWEIILIKMKISARWRRCSKIFKTNLKTHISPLLNRPQGCQGCQKNRKDLRYLTKVRFCANIELKLLKIRNNTKKPAYFDDFYWIWRYLCNSFNFGWILAQKRT